MDGGESSLQLTQKHVLVGRRRSPGSSAASSDHSMNLRTGRDQSHADARRAAPMAVREGTVTEETEEGAISFWTDERRGKRSWLRCATEMARGPVTKSLGGTEGR